MYAPRIEDELVGKIYRLAKIKKRTMTKVLDDIIREHFFEKDDKVRTVCGNCYQEVEVDIGDTEVYCPFCEAVVFAERREELARA